MATTDSQNNSVDNGGTGTGTPPSTPAPIPAPSTNSSSVPAWVIGGAVLILVIVLYSIFKK